MPTQSTQGQIVWGLICSILLIIIHFNWLKTVRKKCLGRSLKGRYVTDNYLQLSFLRELWHSKWRSCGTIFFGTFPTEATYDHFIWDLNRRIEFIIFHPADWFKWWAKLVMQVLLREGCLWMPISNFHSLLCLWRWHWVHCSLFLSSSTISSNPEFSLPLHYFDRIYWLFRHQSHLMMENMMLVHLLRQRWGCNHCRMYAAVNIKGRDKM